MATTSPQRTWQNLEQMRVLSNVLDTEIAKLNETVGKFSAMEQKVQTAISRIKTDPVPANATQQTGTS